MNSANDNWASQSARMAGLSYRPDIDGLRAVAVVSVVSFHTFPNSLRSGFVGVDIFFVISGFLITSIIVNGLAKDRFSVATFYARRIKRIFPALVVVLTASLICGAFLLLPDDFSRLGKHTAAGSGFISNLVLWKESNYFDVASETKILLHLWSLGIEEQFYLIWPALLWAAWRLNLNRIALLAVIVVGSFIYNIETTPSNPVAAFYSPVARFWELAAGSLLAKIAPPGMHRHTIGKAYSDLLSILGMMLIAASVLFIRRGEFPGWWALIPVGGACVTILAGPGAWFNRLVLSNPIMVRIGLISYPLYLWHWPLLAFVRDRYGSVEPPADIRTVLVAVAVTFAWLTYHFVERPIRFGYRHEWVAPALISAMVAIGTFGFVDFFSDGFPGRIAEDKASYAAYFSTASPLIQAEYNHYISQNQCNFYAWDSPIPTLIPRKSIDPSCYTKHSDRSVMIIGDSNAADLYYGLSSALPRDLSLLLIWSAGCQVSPIVEAIIATHHCNMANYFALERIKADPPDIILMSSNNSFDISYVRSFAEIIKSHGVKHVLVLGQRPHWKPFLYKIILDDYWQSTPRYIPGHLDDDLMSFTGIFQSQLRSNEPFEFIDEMKQFCTSEGCLAYLGENRREGLITADTVHLRPFASEWLARRQLAPIIMEDLKR